MKIDDIEPREKLCRQSCIACAYACERKLLYQYIWGVTLRGHEVKEAADLGTIYHKFQQLGSGKEAEVKTWVAKKQQTLVTQIEKGEDLDGNMARSANMLTFLHDKALAMARIFWKKFPQPKHFKVIDTEIKHRMEFQGLILSGTIDKLLLCESGSPISDGLWIRDHKSTGRGLDTIFGGAAWSIQGRLYRLLVQDYWTKGTGHIKGFILDGILKPGIKLCGKDEKTAQKEGIPVEDAYLRRVKQWYADYSEKNDGAKSMDSRAVIFTEPIVPNELQHALTRMKDLYTRPVHPVYFDRDITRMACYRYERECKYHDLCSTPVSQWDALFERKYKIKEEKTDD